MPNPDHERLAAKPIYAVLFATADDIDAPYSPIATGPQGQGTEFTVPHGLDREMGLSCPIRGSIRRPHAPVAAGSNLPDRAARGR